MAEIRQIKPADLQIDEENPRILEPNEGQPKALHAIAEETKAKLLVHATDIAQHGLDPSALLIVEELQGTPQRYRVLEGNRRLAALKILENPELVVGSVTADTLKKLRKLNREYLTNPIEYVNCVVMTREESRHWIELRHTGENKGAGLVGWAHDETTRYQSRAGGRQSPPHLQALEFLQRRGDLSQDVRKKLHASTFRRLIDTPAVRSRLGLEVDRGVLRLLAPAEKVARALMHVVDDLTSGRVSVGKVYNLPQRQKYAQTLPPSVAVTPTIALGHGAPLTTDVAPKARQRQGVTRRVRDRLIPQDCALNIPAGRVSQIEQEFRRGLSLEKHVNAIAVLFRVFIELSLDDYLDRHPIAGINNDSTLRVKIEKVSIALEAAGRLKKHMARAIRSANNDTSTTLPGTLTMNGYVHNPHAFPGPSDLRAHWNSLQPLMVAIWT